MRSLPTITGSALASYLVAQTLQALSPQSTDNIKELPSGLPNLDFVFEDNVWEQWKMGCSFCECHRHLCFARRQLTGEERSFAAPKGASRDAVLLSTQGIPAKYLVVYCDFCHECLYRVLQ